MVPKFDPLLDEVREKDVSFNGVQLRPLTVMTFGNSISTYGFYDDTNKWFSRRSEAALALMLVGPQFQFKEAGTATANTDKYGNYGYSGQGVTQFLSDIETTWIPQLYGAQVTPDVIFGVALMENDIVSGSNLATCTRYVDAWVEAMRGRFPGVILHISTPHQDTRVNTSAFRAVWRGVRDYMLTLDNGKDIFVSNLSSGGYGTVADDTQPKDYFTFYLTEGTDVSGVHPTNQGAQVNARIYADTFKRIASVAVAPQGTLLSANPSLTGTASAGSPPYYGTVPTGGSIVVLPVDNGASVVSDAGNPGRWQVGYIWNSASTYWAQYARMSFSGVTPIGKIQLFAKLKITAGAQYVSGIKGVTTVTYSNGVAYDRIANVECVIDGGNRTNVYGFPTTLNGYRDGDVIYLQTPPLTINPNGVIDTIYHDVVVAPGGASGNQITYEVLSSGVVDLGEPSNVVHLIRGNTATAAAANTLAIQAALDRGGEVRLEQNGDFYHSSTLYIGSNTKLLVNPKMKLIQKPTVTYQALPQLMSKCLYNLVNSPVSVTFTWSAAVGNLPTLNWTSHGLAVGDYVLTQGATPTEFNYVSRVVSVTNANAVVVELLKEPPSTATGTITAVKCNVNTHVEGGIWDYDSPTNSNTTGWKNFAIYLGGQNVTVRNLSLRNSNAQALVVTGIRDYNIENIDMPKTSSGGMQVQGCCYNGRITNSSGIVVDDGISISAELTVGYETYVIANGDVYGLVIDGVDFRNTSGTGQVTIYASKHHITDEITVKNVAGTCVNGAGLKLYGFGTTGTETLGSITAENISTLCYYGVVVISSGSTTNIRKLHVSNIRHNPQTQRDDATAFYQYANTYVSDLYVDILHDIATWPVAAPGTLALILGINKLQTYKFTIPSGNGTQKIRPTSFAMGTSNPNGKIIFKDCYIPAAGGVDYIFNPNTASELGTVRFENNYFYGTCITNNGFGTVPNNTRMEFSGNIIDSMTYGAIRCVAGPTNLQIISDGTNKLINGTIFATSPVGTVDYRFFGNDIQIDPIAADASVLVANARNFFYNTNAAFGAGIGLYGGTTGGAWQLIY